MHLNPTNLDRIEKAFVQQPKALKEAEKRSIELYKLNLTQEQKELEQLELTRLELVRKEEVSNELRKQK